MWRPSGSWKPCRRRRIPDAMTSIRLPSRQTNIRISLLMSAALHVAVAATLLLAAAESGLPRILKAEGPNLNVSWISVVPAVKEIATAPAGKTAPRVSTPAVPAPESKVSSRPKEDGAAPAAATAAGPDRHTTPRACDRLKR